MKMIIEKVVEFAVFKFENFAYSCDLLHRMLLLRNHESPYLFCSDAVFIMLD